MVLCWAIQSQPHHAHTTAIQLGLQPRPAAWRFTYSSLFSGLRLRRPKRKPSLQCNQSCPEHTGTGMAAASDHAIDKHTPDGCCCAQQHLQSVLKLDKGTHATSTRNRPHCCRRQQLSRSISKQQSRVGGITPEKGGRETEKAKSSACVMTAVPAVTTHQDCTHHNSTPHTRKGQQPTPHKAAAVSVSQQNARATPEQLLHCATHT